MTILIALRYKDQTVLGTDGHQSYDGHYVCSTTTDKWMWTPGGLCVGIPGAAGDQQFVMDHFADLGDPGTLARSLYKEARERNWNELNTEEARSHYGIGGALVDAKGRIWEMMGDGYAYRPEPVDGLEYVVEGCGRHVARGAILSQLLWLGDMEDDLESACMNALRVASLSSESCNGTLRVHVLKPGSNTLDHTLIYETERHGLANVTSRREDPE